MLQKLGTGWRRTALINTSTVLMLTLFGIILLICTVSKSGGLGINYIIFQGTCKKSRSINTWLHLFLNACSTGILASSNFFMQVLTSPTRSEVDKAHSNNISLKIGVQSIRNLYRAPRTRLVFWVLFFVTSFPLHLFFNSAIFQTEYMSSDWNLTIASEGFIYDAQYYPPGVAVWAPMGDLNRSLPGAPGYGENLPLSEYFDPKSDVSKRIKFAADHAHEWKRLEVPDCLDQYQNCSERVDLGDLVMIVKSNNLSSMASDDYTQGWKQSAIFNLTGVSDGPKDGWHQNVHANATNSLWYTASCKTWLSGMHQNRSCLQTCRKALAFSDLGKSIISSQTRSKPPASIPSTYTHWFLGGMSTTSPDVIGDALYIDLEYCLAQELPRCKVCVSNGLLLIVVISIALKAYLCLTTLCYLSSEDPFVVPGDAITSFIRSPDKFTTGRCLLDGELEGVLGERSYPFVSAPMHWHPERRRWSRSIEGMVWARNYALLIANFMFLFAMFFLSQSSNPLGKQSFSQSVENGILDLSGATAIEFIPAVLKVNLPQLLLSLFYFNYNSLFTRLCAEKEWSSYGTNYQQLRVTEPQGQQRSTFRLQLPYQYSIPLILASILLHWLVSKALYVFVFEGGYFGPPADHSLGLQTGLSDDAFIGIGWSAPALLALLVVVSIMAILPLIFTRPTIKSPMPLAVSSSLVLSAACHVPILEDLTTDASERSAGSKSKCKSALGGVEGYSSDQEAAQRFSGSTLFERERLLAPQNAPLHIQERGSTDIESHAQKPSDLDIERYLLNVSQSHLRWGEARAQVLGGKQRFNVKNSIGHLSFGTRQHDVGEPIKGRLYT